MTIGEEFYRRKYPKVKELQYMDIEIINILDGFIKENQIETLSFFNNLEEKEKYKKAIIEVYKNYSNADNHSEIKELQSEIDNNIKQIEKWKIKQSAILSCT